MLVGGAISLFFIIVLRPVVYREDGKHMPTLLAVMLVLSAAFVAYMELFPFPADVDAANLASALKNSYTLLGALAGMLVVYKADKKLNFTTEAPFSAQVLKVLLGLVLVLAVKEGLKFPLDLILKGHMAGRAIRYCAVVITAGILWPLAFPWLCTLGKKA